MTASFSTSPTCEGAAPASDALVLFPSTAPENPTGDHRQTFARQATLQAFGARAQSVLDAPGFRDRSPNQQPRYIGKIAAKVTMDAGQASVQHWLDQAAKADSTEKREAALETARRIARLAGIPHANLIGRGAV